MEQVQPHVNAAAYFAAFAHSLSMYSSCASVNRYEELDKAAEQGATARAARVASLQQLISDSDQLRSAQSANHLTWLSTHLKSQKEGFGERSAAASHNRTKRKRAQTEAEAEAEAESEAEGGSA
jgi:hypothetical protein